MSQRFPLQLLLVSIGIALLFAGLFFDLDKPVSQAASTSMPTPNRLAKPTLPADPSQADRGAQVYWLSCLPCHGDRGQGLTEEFKQTYPAEDRNCWKSGCHGDHPYQNGFTLPKNIPALIGTGTLQKFPNAMVLRSYIYAAMPFWKPGNLTEQESWQVTAFLLRENKIWTGPGELTASNADRILVSGPSQVATPQPAPATSWISSPFPFIAGLIFLILLLFLLREFRKK